MLTRQKIWPAMALLLESLTVGQLMEAASQAEKHQPITDPGYSRTFEGGRSHWIDDIWFR